MPRAWPTTAAGIELHEASHPKDEDTYRRGGRAGKISEEKNWRPEVTIPESHSTLETTF